MATDNNNKVLNVPNLRFPGFGGEWEREKLRDKCSFYSGGTPSSSNKSYYNGEIPFIRSGEISGDSTELFLSEFGLNNSSAKMVDIGDLLLALYGATSGQIAISKIRGAINQAILCIKSSYDNIFLKSVWEKHVDKILQAYLQGGQGNLSADIVKNLSFYFPSLDEQNKISKLIVLIDERIETQNKIIEQLQSLIKGIVVEHYNKSHKTKVKIKDLGKSYSVMNMSKEDLSETGNECIIYGELFTTYDCVATDVVSKTQKSIQSSTISTGYDLLFPASTTVDAQSLIAPTAISQPNIILGGDMFGIVVTNEYNNEYLSYIFNYVYKYYLARYAQGSTIIHLHYNDIKNLDIELPDIKAQNELVLLLKNIQDKILTEKKMLSMLGTQKAYLLRNLFI